MSSNNIISVIDIGTTKIVALIGKREANGTFTILGKGHVQSKGVTRGNVLNIIDTSNSIKEAVDIAEKAAGMKMTSVYVGIAGQNIACFVNSDQLYRNKSDEIITKQELDQFIKSQENVSLDAGRQIVQIIPKQFNIDGEIVENPIGCIGKRLEAQFHIITALSNNINSIKRCIEHANLKLKKIFLEPIASARAVLYPEELEAGVAMIDIGGGTSDLAIYQKNMLIHTGVIPFGGNAVTLDLEKIFGLTNKDAENLKVKFGKAIPEESDKEELVIIKSNIEGREKKEIDLYTLSNIIKARIEEIFGFINQQIALVNTQKQIKLGIVLTGGGALLKNLPQLASFLTTFENRIGIPLIHINELSKDSMNNPQYATAIGLLILGYENEILTNSDNKNEITSKLIQNDPSVVINNKDAIKTHQQELNSISKKDKEKTKKQKGGILTNIKNTISGIFDDSDSNL
ncbi:MAG: cell division protein FtsA [Bacteroidales bacterium]|nr:cell division protein FtsA [Bacteroidales bacterium]